MSFAKSRLMLKHIFLHRALLQITSCLLLACCLTGCVSPKTQVTPGAKLETYRKVYLLETKEDPRNVGPRVKPRLDKAGFKVTTISPDGDPVDAQGTGFVINQEGNIL